jgi:hypothetical protein
MEFHCYQLMTQQDEEKAIKSITGFVWFLKCSPWLRKSSHHFP